MMRLEAREVTGGYGSRDVVRGVSLACASGEFVGLIGPNGCGKSTLLRLLSGILRPRQGAVWLEERVLTSFTAREIARRMAFVPQEEKAAFEFTVQDVVLMGRFAHRAGLRGPNSEDYAIVERALTALDVGHLKARSITELSGGEHRRVLLARGLAQQTPLLLLDEPTAHLDITHQAELLEQTRGLTHDPVNPIGALAALHDLNQAAEFCDRLVLMHEGRVLAQGTPDEVLQPDGLRIAYQGEAQVGRNPVTGRPMLFALRPLRAPLTAQLSDSSSEATKNEAKPVISP